jgi:hypothetical protein
LFARRVIVRLFFDPVLKILLLYPLYKRKLKTRLETEANAFGRNKLDHLSKLLELNHQRVSASISHTSIMIAGLLFSGRYVMHTPISERVIAVEIVIYLLLTVALLRCVRDFGLDKDYIFPPEYSSVNYIESFHNEITFRFAILGVCNFLIIVLALIFAGLLVYEFSASDWRFPAIGNAS